ncbi:MAG: J domain-containing protein [Bryobacteraceae bacterium]
MSPKGIERRRRPRLARAQALDVKVSYQVRPGIAQVVPARLIDIHQDGAGLMLGVELLTGMPILLAGDLVERGKEVTVRALVAWCSRVDDRTFRAGVQFADPLAIPESQQSQQKAKPEPPPSNGAAPVECDDLYDLLQISPKADMDMIHRVYRLMAQRYHPDNKETGDSAMFRRVLDAYKTLSDPEKRASYDSKYHSVQRKRWQVFDQSNAIEGAASQKAKRDGILGLLYTKRVTTPDSPAMNVMELEDLLGVAREHLEFPLWYLKENGLIQRGDNGRFTITVKGVDIAESSGSAWQKADRLLPSAAPVQWP